MFDALVLPESARDITSFDLLPEKALVGTSSIRRRAQLLFHRNDLNFEEIRGNVETRLRKLDEGQCDALVLAQAGLQRLGLASRISLELAPPLMLPAVGQGALGIECRSAAAELRGLLAKIDHAETHAAVTAERRLLARLRAGCHAPVGVSTSFQAGRLTLEAVVLSPDGRQRLSASAARVGAEADELGEEVAAILLDQGAADLINPNGPTAG